jgi:DNA-binding transcriptional ArsR family regulator
VIRIELDEATVARTRIATSPLWETVCSTRLLTRHPGDVPFPYAGWARRARAVLAADDAVAAAVEVLASHQILPDFFSPVPMSASAAIEEELEALRGVDRDVVHEQLAEHFPDGVPAVYRAFEKEPGPAMRRLADGIEAYWTRAIAPQWPAMRAMLEEEVYHRARALAADGPDSLLAGLHERVRWQAPTLTLEKHLDYRTEAFDRRLILVPLIFSEGALMFTSETPGVVAISYQARGAAVLADEPGRRRPAGAVGASSSVTVDRLGALVGPARAAVLRDLQEPATTAALALRLGLAASTVSEHLAGLHSAGMVYRSRVGRRVFYGLEPTGIALLNLLDDTPREIRAAG